MKWNSSRWILFAALFLLFISTCLKPILNYLGYWTVFPSAQLIEKITVPDYNNAVHRPPQAPVPPLQARVPAAQQDVDISFQFKAKSIYHNDENIMQTADKNGIHVNVGLDRFPKILIGLGEQDKY